MNVEKLLRYVGVVFLVVSFKILANVDFIVEPRLLSDEDAQKYWKSKSLLDSWTGNEQVLAEAEAILESLLAKNHSFVPGRVEQARLVIMSGVQNNRPENDYNLEALKILKDVQQIVPNYSKAYVLAGHVLTNLRRYEEAKKNLDIAQKIGTKNPWLPLNLATLYGETGEFKKALQFSKEGFYQAGNNEKALRGALYNIILFSSKTREALDKSELVDSIFRANMTEESRLRVALSLIESYSGNRIFLDIALHIILRELKSNKYSDAANYTLATWHMVASRKASSPICTSYEEEKVEDAKKIFESLTKTNEYKKRAYNNLLELAIGKKDYAEAERILVNASNNLESSSYAMQKAKLYFCQNDFKNAIDTLLDGSRKNPALLNSEILFTAYSELGDNSKLEEYHLRRIENDKDNAWLYGNYAFFLFSKMGKIDKSIEFYKKALSIMNYRLARMQMYVLLYVQMKNSYDKGDMSKGRDYYDQIQALGHRAEFEKRNTMMSKESGGRFQEALEYYDNEVK